MPTTSSMTRPRQRRFTVPTAAVAALATLAPLAACSSSDSPPVVAPDDREGAYGLCSDALVEQENATEVVPYDDPTIQPASMIQPLDNGGYAIPIGAQTPDHDGAFLCTVEVDGDHLVVRSVIAAR